MSGRNVKSVLKVVCFFTLTMAQKRNHSNYATACQRFIGVKGHLDRKNNVITCGSTRLAKQHIIFFGGDVQDYHENMIMYNEKYKDWDLESTARLVMAQFPDSAVFVIKPSYMYLNTFSMYLNFLLFDEEGRPEFSDDFLAFLHLKELYDNVKHHASESNSCEKTSNDVGAENCVPNVPVKLIGFSKGCVVLNQLVFGLKHALECMELKPFLNQIEALYWLDGGHIGEKNAYITDDETLETLVAWNKELIVNVTPYQVKDPMRRWIGKEEKEFVAKLKDLNAKIKENRHFMNVPASIEKHFEVLKNIH